jgi:putative cell wall-binding protein
MGDWNYNTFAESFDGTSWSISPSPSYGVDNVSCTSSTFCVAVGSYPGGNGPRTLVETFDGTSWSIAPSPNPGNEIIDLELDGIFCTSSIFCVAVGSYYYTGSSYRTLVETFDGTSWSITASQNSSSDQANLLDNVSCAPSNFCVAVGSYDNGGTLQTLVETGPVPPVMRVFGQDAIATAIAVSQARFPEKGSAKAVVLARSDFFSDALAGGPLAAQVDGPLLITPGASLNSSLDPRVLAEIQRVLPAGQMVYILGGDLALSSGIDTTLEGLGYKVAREAGADEYATAVDIAEQLGNPKTIFEATGLSFYDSLSAVPAAVESQGAILLTDGSTQAPETSAYLAAHTSDTRYAIGGPLAAYGADPSATPIYGQDLYGTSAAVATHFLSHPATFGAATSASFSDALSGGPAMGLASAPILLVPPSGALPAPISQYLSSVASGLSGGTLYGGPLAVGDDVLGELDAIMWG